LGFTWQQQQQRQQQQAVAAADTGRRVEHLRLCTTC
jgi:membrane protease subunit (stomatin/prohibitin family)